MHFPISFGSLYIVVLYSVSVAVMQMEQTIRQVAVLSWSQALSQYALI